MRRSQDVKQMQKEQVSVQEQLRAAEDRSAGAEERLTSQQKQRQQLIAACESILAWVRTCRNVLNVCTRPLPAYDEPLLRM